VRRRIQLQQSLEGPRLDVEEMGHLHPLVQLSKRDLLHQFRHVSPALEAQTASPPTAAKNFAVPG
jgi:hypothetical protein